VRVLPGRDEPAPIQSFEPEVPDAFERLAGQIDHGDIDLCRPLDADSDVWLRRALDQSNRLVTADKVRVCHYQRMILKGQPVKDEPALLVGFRLRMETPLAMPRIVCATGIAEIAHSDVGPDDRLSRIGLDYHSGNLGALGTVGLCGQDRLGKVESDRDDQR
jgi:hypothetical protein